MAEERTEDTGRRGEYPRQVGGLTVYDRYQEELANSYVANMRAGNREAARINQFELSGRIIARTNRGRVTSGAYGAAEAFGLGNWFADTAGAIAGLSNREAMPQTREERAAWRHGLRAGMQTENPVGYYGGQILATLPAAEATAAAAVRNVPQLAAREGQRVVNVLRATGVGAASEAPLAAVRASGNQVTGRYEDEGGGPDALLGDVAAETLTSGGFSGTLNALGAAAGPALRGTARWLGYDREAIDLLTRRSAEAQLQDGGRAQRLQEAGALDVDLRPSSVVSPADAAEIARLSARARQAQATFREAAADEIQAMQGGMQQGIRRAADAVDMAEAPRIDTGTAPAGGPRVATETPMDFGRQPLTTQPGVRRTTVAELNQEAGQFADEAMAALEAQNPTVALPDVMVDILQSPGIRNRVSAIANPETGRSTADEMYDIMTAAREAGNPVIVPLRLLEDVRSSINNMSQLADPGSTPQALRTAENFIRQTISDQVPAYGTYLEELAARGNQGRVGMAPAESGASPATGFRGGQRVLTDAPDVFGYAARTEGGPGNIGRAEGAVAALADEAGRSPAAALALADQLSAPAGNVRANVRTALGAEAAQPLEEVSRIVTRGADRQADINRPLLSGGQQGTENTRTAGGIVATLMGRGSAFSMAGLTSQLEDFFAAPPAMVNRMARALSTRDFEEAQRVLRDMDTMGVNLRRWNEFAGQNIPGLVVATTPGRGVEEYGGDRAPAQPAMGQNGGVPAEAAQQIDANAAATLEGMLRDAYAEGDDEAARDYLDQLDRLQSRGNPANAAVSTPEELEAQIRDAYVAGNDDLATSLLDDYDRRYGGMQ